MASGVSQLLVTPRPGSGFSTGRTLGFSSVSRVLPGDIYVPSSIPLNDD